MDRRAQEILDYWLTEVGPERWYDVVPEIDEAIRNRFSDDWERLRAGELKDWLGSPGSALAYLILADQFPRNMFRGDVRAFATDHEALKAAKSAIARGFDEQIDLPERQFFYLPLMHSEVLADQDRCVRLIALSFGTGESLNHARAHREIIRRFGRFPYRNQVLGRASTPAEQEFLDQGGYMAMVEAFAS